MKSIFFFLKTSLTASSRTPKGTKSVKLLGSWDKFSRKYPMERDTRAGADHWKGCHTFTDIAFDGLSSSIAGGLSSPAASQGRNGGLKMGGTYWYYVGGLPYGLQLLLFESPTNAHVYI